MMRRRLLSILLSCCMMLTLAQTAVSAADSSEEIIAVTDIGDESNNLESESGVSGNSSAVSYEAALVLGETVTNYETIEAAVSAAGESRNSGCSVKLLKDITLSEPLWANKGTFTLDLSGFYLTGNFGSTRATLRLGKDSTADLTVKDSSENATGYIKNSTGSGDSAAILAGGGKLTIESGRFYNGLQADDYADVRINGGTFVRTRGYNFEWGAQAGGFTIKVTDGRHVHDLLRDGYELYYAEENRFVNCRSGKQYYEKELTLREHPRHNNNGKGECDCGYICPHNEFQDGVCTVCGTAAVAKLTDSAGTQTKYFARISDAFNAVPIRSEADTVFTVTMLADLKLGADWNTIINRRLTLDLNGHTLSHCWITIKDKTELTVTGSGVMNDDSMIDIYGECTLYVKSGTIESVSVGSSTMGENGTVYLQGGTIGLSLYKSGDAVLTGGTLTSLIQSDATAMGMAPSVPLSGIIPVGYALELEYADGYRSRLPRDTGIKHNRELERNTMHVVRCDHENRYAIQNNCCIYCGAENPIFYELDGGSMEESAPFYCSATEDITLSSPVRNGYFFLGWSGTGLNGITKTVTIPKGSTGQKDYTAHWEEKSGFTVCFDTGGGTTVSDRKNLKWKAPVLSGISRPDRTGYVFLGWKYGNTTVDENTVYGDLAVKDTVQSVTLTADWLKADQPAIGLAANASYCEDVDFTVSGGVRITGVKAGNKLLNAGPDGKYTLHRGLGTVTVTVSDEAGRTASVTVHMYDGHDFGAWKSNGNGTHTRSCIRDAGHTESAECSGEMATCKEKAVCTICHEAYGSLGTHCFTAEVIDERYLAAAATCTAAATYYKSCVACGKTGTETFTAGTKSGHDWVTKWSRDENAHWSECTRCHEKKDRADNDSDGDNIFDAGLVNRDAAKQVPDKIGLIRAPEGEDGKDGTYILHAEPMGDRTARTGSRTAKNPKTGDNSTPILWGSMLCSSLVIGLVLLTIQRRRKKNTCLSRFDKF